MAYHFLTKRKCCRVLLVRNEYDRIQLKEYAKIVFDCCFVVSVYLFIYVFE